MRPLLLLLMSVTDKEDGHEGDSDSEGNDSGKTLSIGQIEGRSRQKNKSLGEGNHPGTQGGDPGK
jgi:hypothetical protein